MRSEKEFEPFDLADQIDDMFDAEQRAERSAEIASSEPFKPPGYVTFLNDAAQAARDRRRRQYADYRTAIDAGTAEHLPGRGWPFFHRNR
jgi:uncharacterized protein involved in type VI secretion and phage assembly